MRISLLGPPGSGKGTQADAIRGRYGIAHVSSGDLLRAAVREGSELGVEAQRYMDAGQLVPSRLVVDLVRERVSSDDCAEGYLLDGFPRAIDQAEMLCGMLDDGEPVLDHVVALEVPEDEVVRRLSGRRNCPECAAIYHVEFSPPATDGVCDPPASSLRSKNRFRWYISSSCDCRRFTMCSSSASIVFSSEIFSRPSRTLSLRRSFRTKHDVGVEFKGVSRS